MLASFLWFACGALCVTGIVRLGPHRLIGPRPHSRGRRAWLERGAARLPDPEFLARIERIEAEVAHERLTGERLPLYTRDAVAEARRALRPTFGISIRVRE
jgi:hypothetical protein